MFPELFELPFIHVTAKSYGVMMVMGFLSALFLMRKMAKILGQDPDHLTNVALYTLIAGVIGARVFYIMHHFSQFRDNLPEVFAVWRGGLEFLGAVVPGMLVIIFYVLKHKLPGRSYLDILAIGLMLGLGFGRIGCFLNGCCFGAPTDAAWAVRFPYGSVAYQGQVKPDLARNRSEPQLDLPAEYFGYLREGETKWLPAEEANKYHANLKPFELLTEQQKYDVTQGAFRCLSIHPAQLYSSANAFLLCAVCYAFWRKFGLKRPGVTFGLMWMLYGPTRFLIELLRNEPYEYGWWTIHNGWTVSQNIGIYLAILGVVSVVIFTLKKPVS